MTHLLHHAPNGWLHKRLGHLVADTQLGGDYPSTLVDKGTPLVKMINIGRGSIINCDKLERIEDSVEIAPRDHLKHGDLLLNTRNSLDLVGKVALWRSETQGAAFNNNLMRIEFKPSAGLLNEYANLWFNSYDGIRQLRRIAIGTTSVAAIYWRDLASLRVCIPPQHEQRKIADILTTWDEALTQLDALIEAQERRKKALMQQLLTGRRRLKGFTDRWKPCRFGDFLVESRMPGNDGSNANKLTVRLYGRGVIQKKERLAGSENTRYYQRKMGQFIYSKLDFLNGAFGIIPGSLDGYESTLDVPAFDFRPTVNSKWLLHFVCREEFYSQQLSAAAGGRKARRVNPSEFLAMKLLAPSLDEQRQIAVLLDTADQQLTLLRTQRTALDQQKRGLMQRLLTGKLRVSV